MGDDERLSIGELASRAGVTPRTIRYYTSEGLLPPPDTRGRYASYRPDHLQRLARIAELKAAYLPLSAIRERLADAEPQQHLEGSTMAQPQSLAGRQPPVGAPISASGEPLRLNPAAPQIGRYEFFPDRPDPAPDEEDQPHTQHWRRIVLAPGVELHLREPLPPQRRRRIADLIAMIREQLADDE